MASTTFATSAPLRKRQKLTTTACEPCRSRKIRCDGNKPTCEACSKRSQQCIYQATPDISSANAYVDSLVNRVAQLEQELNNARTTILRLSTSPSIAAEPPQQQQQQQQQHHHLLSNIDPRLLPENERVALEHGSVDAMGGDAGTAAPDDAQTFYGDSSALGFTRQMYGSIIQKSVTPEPTVSEVAAPSNAAYMPPESFSLLPRELSDHLLSLYWSRVHVLYPFLHKDSFNKAYEDLWKPSYEHHARARPGLGLGASKESGPSSIIFHCAFNAALALGMQFSDLPLGERERLSSACLAKSKHLLRLDLFDDGSLALVQTLLLLTQYFQSTSWPSKCWTSIGLACRLAQGLGLHVEEEKLKQAFEGDEREMRRRVWHGCVSMDIIVSMTLGRPAMLVAGSSRSLPGPFETQTEVLKTDGGTKLFSIDFFAQTVKLYRIVGRILQNIYKINDEGPSPTEDDRREELVRGFEEDLTQFAHDVPHSLKWTLPPTPYQDGEVDDIAARQSHVLHVRFLHARILLLRPIFLQVCRAKISGDGPSMSVAELFERECALACARMALELIDSIKVYSATGATGAWWYNVFYTRTAAMVVLVSGICPQICKELGSTQWEEAWTNCVEILTKRLPQYKTVKACLAALDTLRRSILHQRSITGFVEESPGSTANKYSGNGPDAHENGMTKSDPIPDYGQFLLDPTFDPYSYIDSDVFAEFGFDLPELSG